MKREVEYFFLINPPDRIDYQISRLKKSCAKHVGNFYGMKSKAHISFGKFIDEEERPGQMSIIMRDCLHLIERGISTLPSCDLTIDGFNFFNHGQKFRSIYATIKLDDDTLTWFNAVKEQLLIDRDLTPHITIARKISIEAFNILWPYFQQLEFKDSFKAECMTILRREFGKTYMSYEKFGEFLFFNKPTTAKPAEVIA
jgi:2'-5' RNA ligase